MLVAVQPVHHEVEEQRPDLGGSQRTLGPHRHGEDRAEHGLRGGGHDRCREVREPGSDQSLPASGVLATAAGERLRPGLGKETDLSLVQGDQVTVRQGEVDVVLQSPPQLGVRVATLCAGGGLEFVHRLVEERRKDLVLAGEVSIDRGAAQAGAGAEFVDADSMKSLFVEGCCSGIEYLSVATHGCTVARVRNDRSHVHSRS